MSNTRTPMREQDPNIRNKNFKEVTLGYSLEEAKTEASRCINCKNPRCVLGCPVNVRIPEFIMAIKEDNLLKAYSIIKDTNNLPAVCGRVCPQEEQCEKNCILGIKGEPIAIGRLERFVSDWARENNIKLDVNITKKNKKVAIIGAGPAGLTCAGDLALKGCDVTIFEAFHKPGGVLMYGIPEFRLPKNLVESEINELKDLGVKFEYDTIIGRTLTIDDLEENYDSIFIASGAGLPRFMNINGEELIGVCSANEYLTRINLMKAYEANSATPILRGNTVVVIGGGNVAMDAARCAKRLGSDVHIVYRRSIKELPARKEEVHHAIDEGIAFDLLCNPIKIIGEEGRVTSVECVRMELGEADSSGRRRPNAIKNSEFLIKADIVIMAIGTNPNPLIRKTTKDLEVEAFGGIKVNEDMSTNIAGLYAGGDAVTGAATVILAMGAGKKAAVAMNKYMEKK